MPTMSWRNSDFSNTIILCTELKKKQFSVDFIIYVGLDDDDNNLFFKWCNDIIIKLFSFSFVCLFMSK